jgi:hypothetical protein
MSTQTDTSKTKVKQALDNVRAAAQELHGAISDAAVKQGGATKADLEAFSQKTKSVAEALKSSISAQQGAAKKALTDAANVLDASQKKAADGMKASGQAFQSSVREVVSGARASVQKISEALAAARAASSEKKPK